MDKEFFEIIKTNQNLIRKVCNMFCKTEDDKKDLFQEILIQLWKSYGTYRAEAKITTWMYRIALNTAITLYRRNRKYTEMEEYQEFHSKSFSSEHSIESTEKNIMLYKAIDQLSGIEKSIILLYMEDFSSDEIAAIIGVTSNNVRVKINRIKAKLKILLEKHYD